MRFVTAFFAAADRSDLSVSFQGLMDRQAILRAWGEFQERYPLIVAPVGTEDPFAVGADRTTVGVTEILRAMRMALAVNTLSLPAVALPVGVGDGLPRSVQIIGPRYREDLCLDAAAAIEERVGVVTPIDPIRP